MAPSYGEASDFVDSCDFNVSFASRQVWANFMKVPKMRVVKTTTIRQVDF